MGVPGCCFWASFSTHPEVARGLESRALSISAGRRSDERWETCAKSARDFEASDCADPSNDRGESFVCESCFHKEDWRAKGRGVGCFVEVALYGKIHFLSYIAWLQPARNDKINGRADRIASSTSRMAKTYRFASNGTIKLLRFGITGLLPILQSQIMMSRIRRKVWDMGFESRHSERDQ